MNRAVSVTELFSKKRNLLPFEGEWKYLIGTPEITGSWSIKGNRKNGKTNFALQLAKYLTNFGRVAYNSLEEGNSETMRLNFLRAGIEEVKTKIILLDKEPISDLMIRLKRSKSPKFIFIDSIQYSGLTYSEYRRLKDSFRDKLFIYISHADGKKARGNVAQSIEFDANVAITVEGFKAISMSRYGGNQPYIIWAEGAQKYWEIEFNKN